MIKTSDLNMSDIQMVKTNMAFLIGTHKRDVGGFFH
ncbi:hypothetical protein SAMN04515679_2241 [Pelosinus fermentans]|uniref:Uncharacterized protein n=1 Tax=Pelosinus fermentans B4 TaxID=1149862 RepID=I9AZ11_9FIRM|nr:hypothetical protein FB4_3611 [Pelosinus fermentans B4]EIW24174.1 hypothetical protein FA11_3611 [Pelosinus fermentans A11]OAM94131.1 hypothetical protein FR7_02149 [Pelosinus fermentans DSM 17108]SDR00823.1 hypothetical protein SAMN04515679_2241 [Pelosinus fermentans]